MFFSMNLYHVKLQNILIFSLLELVFCALREEPFHYASHKVRAGNEDKNLLVFWENVDKNRFFVSAIEFDNLNAF